MLAVKRQTTIRPNVAQTDALTLPSWVLQRLDTRDHGTHNSPHDATSAPTITVTQAGQLRLVSAFVRDAASLHPLALQRRTIEAYDAIHEALTRNGVWQPVRIWNWIPGIRTIVQDGIDRYMVFNAGRFAAYHQWYDGNTIETSMATATGVGHDGSDLVIHALATDRPGIPIENPRQIQSCRYSSRFGPMPPCFSRATLTPQGSHGLPDLLVGGTASVRGEKSMHANDVAAQANETLLNLAHLVAEGRRRCGTNAPSKAMDPINELRRFESMRVFYVVPKHADTILNIVWPYVDHLDSSCFEFVRADICRRELLVEIEGTAKIA